MSNLQSSNDAPRSIFIHDVETVIGIIGGRTKYSILVMQECKTDTHDVIHKSLEICTWLLTNYGINEVRIVSMFSIINNTNNAWIVMDSLDAKNKYDQAFHATNGFRDDRYNQGTYPYITPSMARTNLTLPYEIRKNFLKYSNINQVFLATNIPLTSEKEHYIYIYNINIRNKRIGDIIISYTDHSNFSDVLRMPESNSSSFSLFHFDLFPNAGSAQIFSESTTKIDRYIPPHRRTTCYGNNLLPYQPL